MRSIFKKTPYLIFLSSLVLVVLYSGLSLSNLSAQAQAESSPTPAILDNTTEQILTSGDTEGLVLGAGIILFIIIGGVIIQRMILKGDIESPNS